MIDVTLLTDDGLKTLMKNHEDQGALDQPTYLAAREEQAKRLNRELDLDITIASILASAKRRHFLSYGDVAAGNRCSWIKVRRAMPRHLDLVLTKAHSLQAPLITSIVVNQQNRMSGALEEDALAGFVACARRLGFAVDNPENFLREQQRATFDFARTRTQL